MGNHIPITGSGKHTTWLSLILVMMITFGTCSYNVCRRSSISKALFCSKCIPMSLPKSILCSCYFSIFSAFVHPNNCRTVSATSDWNMKGYTVAVRSHVHRHIAMSTMYLLHQLAKLYRCAISDRVKDCTLTSKPFQPKAGLPRGGGVKKTLQQWSSRWYLNLGLLGPQSGWPQDTYSIPD